MVQKKWQSQQFKNKNQIVSSFFTSLVLFVFFLCFTMCPLCQTLDKASYAHSLPYKDWNSQKFGIASYNFWKLNFSCGRFFLDSWKILAQLARKEACSKESPQAEIAPTCSTLTFWNHWIEFGSWNPISQNTYRFDI